MVNLAKKREIGGKPAFIAEKKARMIAKGLFWYFIVNKSLKFFIIKFVFQSLIEKKIIIKTNEFNKYIEVKTTKETDKWGDMFQKFIEKNPILYKEVKIKNLLTFVSCKAFKAPTKREETIISWTRKLI